MGYNVVLIQDEPSRGWHRVPLILGERRLAIFPGKKYRLRIESDPENFVVVTFVCNMSGKKMTFPIGTGQGSFELDFDPGERRWQRGFITLLVLRNEDEVRKLRFPIVEEM